MENNETKVVIRLLAGALLASLEMNSKRGVIYAVGGLPSVSEKLDAFHPEGDSCGVSAAPYQS